MMVCECGHSGDKRHFADGQGGYECPVCASTHVQFRKPDLTDEQIAALIEFIAIALADGVDAQAEADAAADADAERGEREQEAKHRL